VVLSVSIVAGITVPCVSFPVLLAAGVLVGVPSHLAMIAAVVGSLGVWFGGTRYAIVGMYLYALSSAGVQPHPIGPATSMAFVMAPVILEQGIEVHIDRVGHIFGMR
jgi:MFS superfamily sulfate permease-like transporter